MSLKLLALVMITLMKPYVFDSKILLALNLIFIYFLFNKNLEKTTKNKYIKINF